MRGPMVQRRLALANLAGLACAAMFPGRLRSASARQRIVVIGAGIIGAAFAYRLSRRGARVMVVEKYSPAAGASGRSFAWLNADFSKRPRPYHDLNRLGLAAYRVLEKEVADLPVHWSGALQWCTEAAAAADLLRRAREQQSWGDPVRLVDAEELRRLEPHLRPGEVRAATLAEQEGFVDPAQTTRALLVEARKAGAEVMIPCEVLGLDVRGGRVAAVRTGRGDIAADVVIATAGVDTPTIAAMAGVTVPLVPAPGLLVHTHPVAPVLARVAVGPAAHIKQYPDGRIVIGDDLGPAATVAAHDALATQPADFPDEALRQKHTERLIAEAAPYLPELARAPIERITIGWRPMPRDGYPIIGFCTECPNLYLAVTHSGVTLAPLLSELASIEILDSALVDLLAPYRPARFAAAKAPAGMTPVPRPLT